MGDTYIIDFLKGNDFLVDSIENIQLVSTSNIDFKIEFRWTNDKEHFSDWSNDFLKIEKCNGIECKIKRITNNGNVLKIDSISFESKESEPNKENCYIISNSEVNKFCDPKLGIILNCDSNLFKPNEMGFNPMSNLFTALSNSVAEMFGIGIKYFKVEKNNKSKDVVLHEYTLFDVVDVKDIKGVVPDNKMPSEELNFTAFDMDFVDDFEIHITKEHFERAFGIGKKPMEKDYIYVPILNRVWEVTSTFLSKGDFLQLPVYYKLKLFKYQDRLSVKKSDSIQTVMDSLIAKPNFLEFQNELNRVAKPTQLDNSISLLGKDAIRSSIHENLEIEDLQLDVNFTKISRFCYNLKSIPLNEIGVVYKPIIPNENVSFSGWFNGKGILFAGENFDFSYNQKFLFKTNLKTFEFPILLNDEWFGFVLDCYKKFNQISLRIWKLSSQNQRTNKIELLSKKLINSPLNNLNLISPLILKGANMKITNLRVWNQLIPEEKQAIILNEYSISDGQYNVICDNCLKPFIEIQNPMR